MLREWAEWSWPKSRVSSQDDNLIVREGVKALLDMEDDLDIVGVAADYDELVSGAEEAHPQVVVTDIRMPPNFLREVSTPPRRFANAIRVPAS